MVLGMGLKGEAIINEGFFMTWKEILLTITFLLIGIVLLYTSYLILSGKIKQPENRKSKYDKIFFLGSLIFLIFALIFLIIIEKYIFALFDIFLIIFFGSSTLKIFSMDRNKKPDSH
ncbi:MAG: hypothetical protein JSW00_09035 [Thermoplasmata archaeon]|nr:MAG: hypothetical protein JSW00_09035 [Thermoplasmata archaeon]